MTKDMEELLSLGLKFLLVNKVNKAKVETDVERIKIRLMWDTYWKWRRDMELEEEGEGEEEEDESPVGRQLRDQWAAQRRK